MFSHKQDYDTELMITRQALIEGEGSGEPKKFDFAAFKQKMLARQHTHNSEDLSTSTCEDVQRPLSDR